MDAKCNPCIRCFQCALGLLVAGAWLVFILSQFQIEIGYGAAWNETPPVPGKTVQNALAYVGPENQIWVLELDQPHNPRRLTAGDAKYAQPTWSPDGRWIAYLGESRQRRGIYLNSPNRSPEAQHLLYAQNDTRPFYMMWSCRSDRLGYLVSREQQIELRQMRIQAPQSSNRVAHANRVYWSWKDSGDEVIINVDGMLQQHFTNQNTYSNVDMGLFRIQAPVWDAENQQTYFVQHRADRQNYLIQASENFEKYRALTPIKGLCRIVLSDDGKYLAVLGVRQHMYSPFWSGTEGNATLINTATGEQKTLFEEQVVALFFSPDSSKIALLMRFWGEEKQRPQPLQNAAIDYLEPGLRSLSMHQWVIYDVAQETFTPLVVFQTTHSFNSKLTYFDQYHHSHRFWSPDSRYLVMTAQSAAQQERVWVLDTLQEEAPRQVADGSFAVWSWQ